MARQNINPAAPMADVFELYSTEIDANLFPAYERLREHYPCYWSEGGQRKGGLGAVVEFSYAVCASV